MSNEYIVDIGQQIITILKAGADFGDPAIDSMSKIKEYLYGYPNRIPINYPFCFVAPADPNYRIFADKPSRVEFGGGIMFRYELKYDIGFIHKAPTEDTAETETQNLVVKAETLIRNNPSITNKVQSLRSPWNISVGRALLPDGDNTLAIAILHGAWLKDVDAK